ncbi:MAG: glycoside hydrolase family 3 [Oscillospiraceae bacterium]|nr:glycoside hydrolase family 3 [Oscillospiraceae bacterium]
MRLLWKTGKTYGIMGQSVLMKKISLLLAGIFVLSCTGCGMKIEQTQLENLETFVTETETFTEQAEETKLQAVKPVSVPKAQATESGSETESDSELATVQTTVSETAIQTTVTETVKVSVTEKTAEKTTANTIVNTTLNTTAKPAVQTTTATTTVQTAPPETIPETTEPEIQHFTGNAWDILNQMTLEQKIYQMFIVTPEMLTGAGTVTQAGSWTEQCIYEQPVGGLIYFANNLQSWGQTSAMLENTQNYARNTGIGMFLAVDEEGGLVARCAKKLGTTAFSPMAEYGSRNDWNEAYSIGQTLGNDIGQFGFNVDFAPVADVNLNAGNELGNRIFSDNPEIVGNMVSGVVQGLQNTGVSATLKHFPGLGAEDGNAHYDDKILIDRSLEELRNAEFKPFRSGIEAGADFVMVSHQIITGAGESRPSCLSYTVCTDWLRNELNFNGIIITDSFQMNTIAGSYSAGDAAVLAVEAGVDIILMPADLNSSVQALENAVANGRISESRINDSVYRILAEKERKNLLG